MARPLIAVVGPDSLIGRELRDVLAQGDLAPDIRLVASESDEAGALTEVAGEPTEKSKATIIVDVDDKNCLAQLTVVLKVNQGVRQ